jgi:hypothetical protein
MSASLSPLDRALVLAARLRLGPEDREALETLLREGLPWEALGAQAGRLGVEGLLLRHLQDPDLGKWVPGPLASALEAGHRRTALRTLRLQGLLHRALPALASAQIPVILLKGASLAHRIYPDPALRPMSDVDILIRPGDRARAWDGLTALGFRPGNAITGFLAAAQRPTFRPSPPYSGASTFLPYWLL